MQKLPRINEKKIVEFEGRLVLVQKSSIYSSEVHYTAYETTDGLTSTEHSTLFHWQGRWWGSVSSRKPVGHEEMEGGSPERTELVRSHYKKNYEAAYRAIIAAFPEAKGGYRNGMGDIYSSRF